MVEPTKLSISQVELVAKLMPEAQEFLQRSDLHSIAKRMRDGITIMQEEVEKLQKLGSGGQGDVYDLQNCCLKLCPQFKVGDMHPELKNIEIS
jgi:serine/threonine protein kinase